MLYRTKRPSGATPGVPLLRAVPRAVAHAADGSEFVEPHGSVAGAIGTTFMPPSDEQVDPVTPLSVIRPPGWVESDPNDMGVVHGVLTPVLVMQLLGSVMAGTPNWQLMSGSLWRAPIGGFGIERIKILVSFDQTAKLAPDKVQTSKVSARLATMAASFDGRLSRYVDNACPVGRNNK